MTLYRKQGLSPEMNKALDELEEARREWHQMLADNPAIKAELQRHREQAEHYAVIGKPAY